MTDLTKGQWAQMQALFEIPEQKVLSVSACMRCGRPPGIPVTWLWRNEVYGSALVDCDQCKAKWAETGWTCRDGVWVNTIYEAYGTGDGHYVWSRGPNSLSHRETDDPEDISDNDDDHPTR